LNCDQGLHIYGIEQLAARLAGGFLQSIDSDDLHRAVAAALIVFLTSALVERVERPAAIKIGDS
jgi:hypothetical protein